MKLVSLGLPEENIREHRQYFRNFKSQFRFPLSPLGAGKCAGFSWTIFMILNEGITSPNFL